MYAGGFLSPEEFWAQQRAVETHIREASAAMTTYGLRGWTGPRMLGPWEWQDETVVMAGLRHGDPDADSAWVDVYVTSADPVRQVHTLMMSAMGVTAFSPDYKKHRAGLREAPSTPTTLCVEGEPATFGVLGGDTRWWASGTAAGTGVVLEGRNYPPADVALVRVDDIEPYLDGLRGYIRAARGD